MKCKVYHLLSFVLAFILFVNLQIFSFASTTSGSEHYNWSAGEKFTYFLLNGMNILGDGYSMVIGADDADDVWTDFFDFVSQEYLEENQTFEEWCLSNTSWYYDNSGIENENTVTGFSLSPTMADALQLTVNNYVTSHPLSYKECYISSYNYINTSQFNNYNAYKSVQEIIKNNNGYTFFITPNGLGTNSQNNTYIVTVDVSKYPVNFIGTETSGIFNNNVCLEHNWSTISSLPQNTDGIDIYMLRNQTGYIGASAKTYSQAATNAGYSSTYVPSNALTLLNTNSFYTANRVNVFTNKSSNELIYLFANINAYKNYNSGSPQPYYLGSDFGTHKTNYTVSNFPNSNNSYYNQVINNVQSGWSASDVLTLVDKIINSSSSNSSGGSGSSDDTLDLGFLGKIGSVIGKIITALGGLITGILEGISNALIGEDGTGGILGLVKNVLTSLTELISEDFGEFINGLFSFMPSEIRTVLVAGFTISIFLGVLKLIRK